MEGKSTQTIGKKRATTPTQKLFYLKNYCIHKIVIVNLPHKDTTKNNTTKQSFQQFYHLLEVLL